VSCQCRCAGLEFLRLEQFLCIRKLKMNLILETPGMIVSPELITRNLAKLCKIHLTNRTHMHVNISILILIILIQGLNMSQPFFYLAFRIFWGPHFNSFLLDQAFLIFTTVCASVVPKIYALTRINVDAVSHFFLVVITRK
jgi:hypothetical protein